MTRMYLEAITGIYTGSSMDLLQSSSFQTFGMAGEDHVCDDNDVWITKTHWPNSTRSGIINEREFLTDRALVITRNPIDVLPSYFLLIQTGSQSATVAEKVNEAFPAEWDSYIRHTIPIFKAYHAQVMESLAKEIPAYFFRYEDQTTNSRETTIEFCKVILDQQDINGTVVQHRIDEITKESHEKRAKYTLKSTQTLNRNIGMYSDEQLAFIKSELRDFFLFFGYVDNENDPSNITPFFKYDDLTADELEQQYNGFRKHNAEVIANLGKGEKKCFKIENATRIKVPPAPINLQDKLTLNID